MEAFAANDNHALLDMRRITKVRCLFAIVQLAGGKQCAMKFLD